MPTELMTAPGMNEGGKVKKMVGGGKAMGTGAMMGGMADKAGARAMSPAMKKRMEMAMMKAGAGGAAGRAMKKGGKVKKQGYNARLDDSLGARKGKKKQSMKARRDESKGAKKAAGKKAYSGNRKSAQGSASKRADGIATKGHTKGRII